MAAMAGSSTSTTCHHHTQEGVGPGCLGVRVVVVLGAWRDAGSCGVRAGDGRRRRGVLVRGVCIARWARGLRRATVTATAQLAGRGGYLRRFGFSRVRRVFWDAALQG